MGDILHALPAVTALRLAHPNWVIDWVVEPRWSALLAAPGASERGPSMPLVDHLHLAPTRDWRRHPLRSETLQAIRTLRSRLRAGSYDAVIDLQGAIRSAVLGRMAGARRLIGESEPRERAARWLFTEHVETHGAHVIEQDVELASAVAGDDLKLARGPADEGAYGAVRKLDALRLPGGTGGEEDQGRVLGAHYG